MAVSRRTVTVLFADVVDSTAVGERRDSEATRAVMSRWFDTAKDAIESHGGVVEKFIGDAVMGAFGVPEAHEDDALRAVRAALDLRARSELGIRIGINTGEVVAGDPSDGHAFLSGDAVNTAKRIEQAARTSEILIGEDTEPLVRAAALLEPVDPLVAKGKTEPVTAWRVLAAIPGLPAIARRTDTPLVGRAAELSRLRAAFDRAVEARTCQLFTLLGPAGIGKSRLSSELFTSVEGEASVLVGRCLPYGDGITFWPLTEVLRDIGSDDTLAALLGDDAEIVEQRLCAVTGRGAPTGTQDTFWAVRKVCEALARRQPLVLCFEDVHWAEPTMLDLIEYLAGWIRDAPMLLLCVARPEFLDERPSWLGGDGSASLTLQPLSRSESETLLDALGTSGIDGRRIADAAEGNPLYVEQLAAMAADDGRLDTIPPTIHALLAARLDRLSPGERRVIERAAVAGKDFWRDAIVALSDADISHDLMSLVRKELIRPGRSTARPDDQFRFAHALIRDAAYAGITRESRATLHERFAQWLEGSGDARELDELVGYHLEQAYRNREAIGPIDDATREIARRAADLLGAAGRRAYENDDMPAAIKLLDRAVALLTEESPARLELMRQLSGATYSIGEVARAELLLDGLLNAASALGDRRYEMYAAFMRAIFRSAQDGVDDDILQTARDAANVFEDFGDEVGLAGAWRTTALALLDRCNFGQATVAAERAVAHARAAGSQREESRAVDALCACLVEGPTSVADAIDRVEGALAEHGGNRLLDANLMTALAHLKAMQGSFDDARELYRAAGERYEELDVRLALAGWTQVAAEVESLASRPDEAEALLRRGYALLAEVPRFRGNHALLLADVLCDVEAFDEAQRLLDEGAAERPVTLAVATARVRARILVNDGNHDAAVEVARAAVSRALQTDALNLQGRALLTLAEVLRETAPDEAADAARRARAVYAAKGNTVAAGRVEALLAGTATR
jgi:class 3 adenylate cyclase/tetratricopeptide (TPR) repeat protein